MMNEHYTKFPNLLFDWLLAKSSSLSKRELVVMLAVIRNTIGWHREKAELSCRYIANATGIAPSHISMTVKELASKGLILIDRSKMTTIISLNPDAIASDSSVTESVTVTETVTPKCDQIGNTSVTETVTQVLLNQSHKCDQIGNKQIKEKKLKENETNDPRYADLV